ncbi:hypothetical protein COB21_00550 [Candidatus Aerophobetes bacterium]|uniref:Pre-toxin TG domain-containing protein n=1 Tax=Aerophobetes bacterium TaxID=2030807 RepID=A0A2A4X7D8_UNCAE|nr:MAG: hypothetical protein COB21_00550 [Candidatus Aerophobetes bacterium]
MTNGKLQNIEGSDKGKITPYYRRGTISLIKQSLVYSLIFSLITSTVLAGLSSNDFNQDSDSSPIATFKPIINGFYSSDDWHLNADGSVSGGNGKRIEHHNQPKLLRDAQEYGIDAVRALLSQAHVYVKEDQLTLSLPLFGGGNSGSSGGGGGDSYSGGTSGTPFCSSSGQSNCQVSGGELRVTVTPGSIDYTPIGQQTPLTHGGGDGGGSGLPANTPNNFEQYAKDTETRNKLQSILEYHKSHSSLAYTTLTLDEQTGVLEHAQSLCVKGPYKPDTGALKESIKHVVYHGPASHTLEWFGRDKDYGGAGQRHFKNLNDANSHKIIETAKELSYNLGHKPDSITISKAYDSVMTNELKYVFDYHKGYGRPAYQNLHPEIEREILTRAIGNMKISPDDFKNPDTGPLAEVLRHSEQLGSALLRGYGQTINTVLCEGFGACEAQASGLKLAMTVAPLVGEALAATTVGISAQYLWENKVKSNLTELVDWLHSSVTIGVAVPKINSTPVLDDVKLKILDTWGVEQSVKILQTPESEQLAIKLVTNIYEGIDTRILTQDSNKIFEKNKEHIFGDREGHLLDTPENRALLVSTAKPENLLGKDNHGNDCFSKNLPNGKQVWLHVRNKTEIRDGGVNDVPWTPDEILNGH